jgi:hypothetical protein
VTATRIPKHGEPTVPYRIWLVKNKLVIFVTAIMGEEAVEPEAMPSVFDSNVILYTHVTRMTLFAFSSLSIVGASPMVHLLRGKKATPPRPFLHTLIRTTGLGVMAGAFVGIAMTAGKLRDQTPDSIQDRAYRLGHNKPIVILEEYINIGIAGGLAYGFLARPKIPTASLVRIGLGCAGVGTAIAGVGAIIRIALTKNNKQ